MNARPHPLGLHAPRLAPVTLPAPISALPRHEALSLTEGGTQAQIVLNGQVYSLRITRAGKLILTK
jgi:hemin uptake protein HemP